MGKRRLEIALKQFAELHPDETPPAVRWLPFQLNPDLPPQGISRADYIMRKFGEQDSSRYKRVAAIGESLGLDMQFEKIKVQPNTVKAHRLLHHAGELGKQDALAEALFRAYFIEGANLTDDATLAEYAAQAGLDRAEILTYLATDSDVDLIHSADVEARQVGISGVPFFIINRTVGVSGAQEPDVLLQAMEQARQG
ncbi:MAG: DsbA family oxidoreductase [Burkholderiales bacterium]|nr:DsbA family oxidoreductase [Rubrivivax sp.]MDP2398996.1 DsbA family oxidoreductase [Burkholderiales bacterium]